MVLVALDPQLTHTLNKLASGEPVLVDDFAAADAELGEALAATAIELANQTNLPMSAISVVAPRTDGSSPPGKPHPNTLQIGNPAVVAEKANASPRISALTWRPEVKGTLAAGPASKMVHIPHREQGDFEFRRHRKLNHPRRRQGHTYRGV